MFGSYMFKTTMWVEKSMLPQARRRIVGGQSVSGRAYGTSTDVIHSIQFDTAAT